MAASYKRRLKRFGRWVRRPFELAGFRVGMAVLQRLSHARLFRWCDAASTVYFHLDRTGRRFALENLRLVEASAKLGAPMGPMTRREELILRGSYRNMARSVGHLIWTCRDAVNRVKAVGEMSPGCHAWLQANRPAVTVSGHIGCWEILSQLAFLEGHPMISVAKRIGSKAITEEIIRARDAIGQEIVPSDGAFKALLRGMKKGKSLGLLVDQRVDPDEGGIFVRFFGRPISVSAAPAFFSSRLKAPIITAWSRPLKGGRYRCEVIHTYTPEEAADTWRMTQQCAKDLESVIRRHPSIWVMNYNFFSNIPTEKDLAELEAHETKTRQSTIRS